MGDGTETDQEGWQTPSFFSQTTEEMARVVVAAAAAVRPRPSIVFSASSDKGNKTLRKLQRSWTRLWKGSLTLEGNKRSFFNPEHLTNQKRQWTLLQLETLARKQLKEPGLLFEHMVLVGLHPKTDMEATKAALIRKRDLERDLDGSDRLRELMRQQYRGVSSPKLEPQILYAYPPGKRLPLRQKDLPAFCFPAGLETYLVEQTPSMSEINEVVFGQDYQNRDDMSYVFSLKVADNATLYGVCVYVPELVHNPPVIMAMNMNMHERPPLSRFMVSAHRCYCILTKLPFFDLHFGVLNSIITQERLDRMITCVDELTLAMSNSEVTGKHGASSSMSFSVNGKHGRVLENHVLETTDATENGDVSLFSAHEEQLESAETKDFTNDYHFDSRIEGEEGMQVLQVVNQFDETNLETIDPNPEETVVTSSNVMSPVVFSTDHRRAGSEESTSSFDDLSRSINSEDEEETVEASTSREENLHELETIHSWAEANKNYPLQILHAYYKLPVPPRGASIIFHPVEHLLPLKFTRSGEASSMLLGGKTLDLNSYKTNLELAEAQAAIMAAEEASSLSIWTIAALCRVLSLENVLGMFAAALLEKQIAVICSNLGVLSAVVLSIIPLIRPFQWQCLLLPILPNKMLEFLEAPVPFIVGVPSKTSIVRSRASNIVIVNVQKNKVTSLPGQQLPRFKELASALEPYHSKLVAESDFAKRRLLHKCSDAQAQAAEGFLVVLRSYLESICRNLRSHTITNVRSNNDKVSLLLKESFVEDFSSRDRPFMKLFINTQLFSVHTDTVLSFFETE